jgi:hypothetical protein
MGVCGQRHAPAALPPGQGRGKNYFNYDTKNRLGIPGLSTDFWIFVGASIASNYTTFHDTISE